jgi:HSP20 family molecular chaperone IbpA
MQRERRCAMTAMSTVGLAPVVLDAHVDALASEYVVRLRVTGFTEEELEVETVDRRVTVRGDQTQSELGAMPFQIRERFEEQFELPPDADTGRLTASYARNGLELRAPRTNGRQQEPRKVRILHRFAVNADASGV